MDQTGMIEGYYEQLILSVERTVTGDDADLQPQLDGLDQQVCEVSYNLWRDAQANDLAIQMEKQKIVHFEQLYEFSYGVSMYEESYFLPKGTENIALMIIDEKAAYERNIKRHWQRYKRFKTICAGLDDQSKILFIRYFEKSKKVDHQDLRQAIERNISFISRFYKREETDEDGSMFVIPEPDSEKMRRRQEKMRKLFRRGG